MLAAELYDVELCPWDHEIELEREDENWNCVKVKYQRIPSEDVQKTVLGDSYDIFSEQINSQQGDVIIDLLSNEGMSGSKSEGDGDETKENKLPRFGPEPDFDNFDFQSEIERLPFKLVLGPVDMTLEQQKRFIRMIYEHKKVFSLHDEDLGYCDKLEHSIPTTDDKSIYLPHRTILPQLQGEVRKCLDKWLKQGIIQHSTSPYASQVVLVHKKSGEIRICVDFHHFNGVTIHDAFPLPRIEEALAAVQDCLWFTAFDLAQGYLQVVMKKSDQHKTAFRTGSSGLYEFKMMPFGLSYAGATFCRLMEMCLGDQ